MHKRNVKYFIIANEPGIDQGYYQNGGYRNGNDEDAARIRDYVKEYAVAMKMVDPTIKIIVQSETGF